MATILIVDDHDTNRELLIELLGHRHHKTAAASDGVEGLKQARATRPDLIITDVLMPRMDGYDPGPSWSILVLMVHPGSDGPQRVGLCLPGPLPASSP